VYLHAGVLQVVTRKKLNSNDSKAVVQQQHHNGNAETITLTTVKTVIYL